MSARAFPRRRRGLGARASPPASCRPAALAWRRTRPRHNRATPGFAETCGRDARAPGKCAVPTAPKARTAWERGRLARILQPAATLPGGADIGGIAPRGNVRPGRPPTQAPPSAGLRFPGAQPPLPAAPGKESTPTAPGIRISYRSRRHRRNGRWRRERGSQGAGG